MRDQLGRMVPLEDGRANGNSGGEGTAAGAMHAATHVLAGIIHRDRTGQGVYIDVAASDAVVAQAWGTVASAMNAERVIDPENIPAKSHTIYNGAKYQFYETADDKVVLFCAIEHRFWDSFCQAIDRPDLVPRKNLTTAVDFGNDEDLRAELSAEFASRTQAQWLKLAVSHRIPLGPAPRDLWEMREDPHVQSRAILLEVDHPELGHYTVTGEGALVRDQPFELTRHAPAFNEHGDEIRRELEQLEATGTIDPAAEAR
jgi:crotonobetainyl-CoA:carnitine CoA-transferase CaiB-like acyl-CoA transferase